MTALISSLVLLLVAAVAAATASVQSGGGARQYGKVVCEVIAASASTSAGLLYSCVPNTHKLILTDSDHHSTAAVGSGAAVAWGSWSDTINSTGWASISVISNQSFTDEAQVQAAGYVEGAFSHTRISQHFTNLFQMQMDGWPDDAYTKSLAFIQSQYKWAQQMIASNPTDPIWTTTNLLLTQLSGMVDGYSATRDPNSEQPLSILDFLYFQSANDDMQEVLASIYIANQTNCWDTGSATLTQAMVQKSSHCSAIIKTVVSRPDPVHDPKKIRYDELLLSHNSWFDYRVMLRVVKSYHFPLSIAWGGDYAVLFTSYPGYVWSQDDYYQIEARAKAYDPSSKLVKSLYVMETTNNVCNASLLSLITPHSLFTWQRTVIANILAGDGHGWTEIFKQYNSGTYNNQMMIVDVLRFTPGSDHLVDGLFWIIEQMPGNTIAGDMTHHLRVGIDHEHRGYWASYNVPYFPETWITLGYAETYKVFGDQYSHDKCARAQIFRRDHITAVDVESLQKLQRENNWQTDPLSHGNPFFAIAARGDLVPGGSGVDWVNKSAVGCVDAKVTTASLMLKAGGGEMHAISGPTTENQPPFNWDSDPVWSGHSHVGQPSVWAMDWQRFKLVR